MSIVRENLMSRKGYTPYCGNVDCRFHMPRTRYIGGQFQCGCGWRSSFDDDFIEAYEAKWADPPPETKAGGTQPVDNPPVEKSNYGDGR
jgi:hypothetical protein